MKQYKLIIKENLSGNLNGILNNEALSGWKLNSYESTKSNGLGDVKNSKQRVVLVFEK